MKTNENTVVSLKLSRADTVRLMLASIKYSLDEPLDEYGRKKWTDIYDKMREQLDEFDEKQKKKALYDYHPYKRKKKKEAEQQND